MNLRSNEIVDAVRDIERRAERELDETKLRSIYVDCGVLSEMSPRENQVVYGRRGVGKTHLLHYYGDELRVNNDSIIYQVHDCTRLGSGFASDNTTPLEVARRCFNQLLNDIANHCFDYLDITGSQDQFQNDQRTGHAVLAFQDAINKRAENGESFDFRMIGDTLDKYRELSKASQLYICLDEFVAILNEAQPYFAEFLKRSFFSKPKIVTKIAAVSYSTRMSTHLNGDTIGLEPGADSFGDVDLDQHFVWEEGDSRVEGFFAQVLYNHLAEAIGLGLHKGPEDKRRTILQIFFANENAFKELCRAAEGNCRDLLNIFRLTFFSLIREVEPARIGVPQVKKGAEEWYYSEKIRPISDALKAEEFLNHLIEYVIREKKTKTFMVHYKDRNHPVLVRFYSARLLHPLRTVWKHPDKPGEPYHLVTMDYGSYVALKNSRSAPDDRLFFEPDATDYDDIVPLDDRRSIRRVVLTRQDLDRFLPTTG